MNEYITYITCISVKDGKYNLNKNRINQVNAREISTQEKRSFAG